MIYLTKHHAEPPFAERDRPVEIEITPQMIAVGEAVIEAAVAAEMVFPDLLAVRVFQAMLEAEA